MASPQHTKYDFYYWIWVSLPPYNQREWAILISCSTPPLPQIRSFFYQFLRPNLPTHEALRCPGKPMYHLRCPSKARVSVSLFYEAELIASFCFTSRGTFIWKSGNHFPNAVPISIWGELSKYNYRSQCSRVLPQLNAGSENTQQLATKSKLCPQTTFLNKSQFLVQKVGKIKLSSWDHQFSTGNQFLFPRTRKLGRLTEILLRGWNQNHCFPGLQSIAAYFTFASLYLLWSNSISIYF